jgi:hypothetical protein
MKIEDVALNTTVEKRDRNYLVQIAAPVGEDVKITCYRQVVLMKDGKEYRNGGENGEGQNYTVEKNLSEVLAETVTLPAEAGGITLTAGQVALALEMLTDKFATVVA